MKDKNKKNDPVRKAKRKKFWLGFLRVVLIIATIIIILKLIDVFVEKTIDNAELSFFEFSKDEDNLQHVTADFKVPLKMKSKNGKYHKVKWTESSSYASIDKEGNVTIKEPGDKNVKLVLWENYGWFIFKGKRQYVLDLVTSNVQQYDSDADIPISKVLDGSYNRRMDVLIDEEDNVEYVFGDFGKTQIYNEGDALAYIQHNRQILNIPDELEIRLSSFTTSKKLNTYNIDLYYLGTRVDDNSIVIAVSNEDYKPQKITCDITRGFSTLNENVEIDFETCKDVLKTKYEVSDLIVSELETVIIDNKYCSILNVEIGEYTPFEVCINKESLEILYDNSQNELLWLDSVELSGRDEFNNIIKFEGSTDGKYTYMYDLSRNIRVYRLIDEVYNTNDLLERETAFGGIKKQLVFSNSIKYDPSFSVEVESINSMQNIYDTYYRKFGWRSYDNKGREINIYTNREIKFILFHDFYDNAMWNPLTGNFSIAKSKYTATSLVADPTTLAHEYTHGVYDSILGNKIYDIDYNALDEATADVMAICLTRDSTWEAGKFVPNILFYTEDYPEIPEEKRVWNLCMRDLKKASGGTRMELCSMQTPRYYDDNIYNYEKTKVHNRSVLISNIAYQMYESGEFTQDEIAELWFMALRIGFGKKVTLPRFRTNLIEAIELECIERKEQKIDVVKKLFDTKHIYDETLQGKISRLVYTYNNSIEGDPILDDSVVNSYYIFYSPISFLKAKTNVFIVESPASEMPDSEISTKEIEEKIEEVINDDSELKKDHDELLEAKKELDDVLAFLKKLLDRNADATSKTQETPEINVIYLRVPKYIMVIIQNSNKKQEAQVKENILDMMEVDEDSKFWNIVVDVIWRLMFHDEYYETTAYDFYSSL